MMKIVKHLSVWDQEHERYITHKIYFFYGLGFPGRFCGIKWSKRHTILCLAYGSVYRQNKLNHKIQKKKRLELTWSNETFIWISIELMGIMYVNLNA